MAGLLRQPAGLGLSLASRLLNGAWSQAAGSLGQAVSLTAGELLACT